MGRLGPIGGVCQHADHNGRRGTEYRDVHDRRDTTEGAPHCLQPAAQKGGQKVHPLPGRRLHAIAERGAIQNSEEILRALSARYESEEGHKTIRGIVFPTNQKTVAKGRKHTSVADWAEGCQIHGADARREGVHRRVPPAHAVAAGRLSLYAASDDAAPDAIIAPPLFAVARHQPIARGRWRQACEEEIQGLPARLLSR